MENRFQVDPMQNPPKQTEKMAVSDPFAFLAVDKELVCTFFAVFSRFEFALKDCGYVREENGTAAPAWRRFAKEGTLECAPNSEIEEAVHYLVAHPPQVQDTQLNWQNKPFWGTTDTARAIESAQRTRNNLFHGGKHAPYSPPGRDAELVRCSLMLLDELIAQNPDLKSSYESAVF